MKTYCFYFQIHQPFRLKKYRFFDIGNDHYYYDDFLNEEIMQQVAHKCYLPANQLMLEMIKKHEGKFKIAFSISGVALDQMETYTPEVIESFKELADTGCVEFLAETYAHSLASLSADTQEFVQQIQLHSARIASLFGVTPTVLRNTELIYSDDIAAIVQSLGFKGMITEGAKHILGWRSPNFVYQSASAPDLKLLLKNSGLSEEISHHFSDYGWRNYPLTADKFADWVSILPEQEKMVNIFINYEAIGSSNLEGSGIFDFFRALPDFVIDRGDQFATPSEVIEAHTPVGPMTAAYPISWVDEERDCSAWTGNVLQQEALRKLEDVGERVRMCQSKAIQRDWLMLQCSDHFYYMSTKHKTLSYSPYSSPYEAFNNYMNILSDFIIRVKSIYPDNIESEELAALVTTIKNQDKEIQRLRRRVERLKSK